MLSSPQVQAIDDAIKAGRVVLRNDERIFGVEYPEKAVPVLALAGSMRCSVSFVAPMDIIIGDKLSVLKPR